MGVIYASDTYLQLHQMASSFSFAAQKLDKKIEELMVRVITKEREQFFHEQLRALGNEVYDLKENQQLLKRDFSGTIMKFCRLLGEEDCVDQDQLELKFFPQRGVRTEGEIKLAMQEIDRWNEKEVELSKERRELALRFVRAFPCEEGYFKKDMFHDVDVVSYDHTKKDHEIDDDMIPLTKVSNGTWGWHKLEGVEKSDDDQVEWSLTEVMLKMYGFKLDRAKKEEQVIRHWKGSLLSASKKHRDLTKNNLINELLRQKRNKLAVLLEAIEAIKKSREFDEEVQEAEKLMLEWLYQIEREIFFLFNDLVLIVWTYNQVVVAAFRKDFRSKLEVLRRRQHGRVPVVVYRILSLLEGEVMEGSIVEEGKGLILLKKIHVGQFMDQLYKMILLLTSVLNANSSVSSLSMSKKKTLLECVEIVRRCDEAWRAIRMEVDESMRGSIGIDYSQVSSVV